MKVEVKVPPLAESIADATLLDWRKKVGDAVQAGEPLIDLETDKVTLEVTAPASGVLTEIAQATGSTVVSDALLAIIDTAASATASAAASATAAAAAVKTPAKAAAAAVITEAAPAVPSSAHLSSPSARKQMAEQAPPPAAAITAPSAPASGSVASKTLGDERARRAPMSRLRKRAAQRLLEAQQQHAILTTFNEINMAPVMALREKYRSSFEQNFGVKLGFMSFFARACVEALKAHPIINASTEGDDILYHDYIDLGIAVASDRGLVVPVIRDANGISFAEFELKLKELSDKAKAGQLSLDDLSGGTFTLTNGGVFGSLLSTPILNPPQSAILGMHSIQQRPVAEYGQVVIRPMMYVALSYDHRIIDGRDAVQFLVAVKELLEDPGRMLLSV